MAVGNALNINQTGLVKLDGSTGIFTSTTTTNHNVLIGAASNAITNVAPSATTGVALVSQGAAADPAFSTVSVAGGGTGAVTLTGVLTGNGTSAITASTVTNHGVIIGGASNAVSSTAVGSTGQVLQANTGADPTYSTATFPSTATGTGTILRADGTNWVATTATYPSTTTVNQILYSSAANVVSGLTNGTTGQVLTATTGSAPSWQSPAAGTGVNKVITQTFSTAGSGTYTPSSGMLYCIVEVVGGGGGGGGSASTTASQLAVGGGGGSGSYARTTFSAADIGASKTYTVGAGGAGGTAGANNGSNGTNTTFGTGGTLVQGGAGGGGNGGAASGTVSFNLGGVPGTGVVPSGGTGAMAAGGAAGEFGASNFGVSQWNGRGAQSYFGQTQQYRSTTGPGGTGSGGSGGSGAYSFISAAAQAGGNGGDGIIIITEYTT